MLELDILPTVRVVDPELFVSDPTPVPVSTKKVLAPIPDSTPDPDPVSDPATLVSASRDARQTRTVFVKLRRYIKFF
jgi:hypothetical protein